MDDDGRDETGGYPASSSLVEVPRWLSYSATWSSIILLSNVLCFHAKAGVRGCPEPPLPTHKCAENPLEVLRSSSNSLICSQMSSILSTLPLHAWGCVRWEAMDGDGRKKPEQGQSGHKCAENPFEALRSSSNYLICSQMPSILFTLPLTAWGCVRWEAMDADRREKPEEGQSGMPQPSINSIYTNLVVPRRRLSQNIP